MNIDQPSKEQKNWRWIVYSLCIFLGLCIFVFGITPSILSSKSGQRILEKHLSKKLDGSFSVENLNLSWFGYQKIHGVEFKSNINSNHFSIESIAISNSLWNLFITKNYQGSTVITAPSWTLDTASLKKDKEPKKTSPTLLRLTKKLIIKNADITILSGKTQNIEFYKTDITYNTSDHNFIDLKIKGSSKMTAHAGQFDIDSHFSLKQLEGKLQKQHSFTELLNNLDLSIKAKTINFPILGVDHLMSLKNPKLDGFLVSIFGPMLNSDINIELQPSSYAASLDLLSKNIKTSCQISSTNKGIGLNKSAFFSFNVNTSLYEKLSSIFHFSDKLKLAKDGYLQLSLEQLFVPKVDNKYDFEKTSFSGRLASSSLMFKVEKIDDFFNFNTFNLSLTSPNVSSNIEVVGQSSINYKAKNPALINFSFDVSEFFLYTKTLDRSFIKNAKIDVSYFPLDFVDKILNLNNKLVDVFGDSLSLKVYSQSFPEKNQFTSSILTPKLHIPNIVLSIDESIYLEKPAKFLYLPDKQHLLKKLTTNYFKPKSFDNLKGEIEAFGISLDNIAHKRFDRIELQMNLSIGNVEIDKAIKTSNFSIKDIKALIYVDTIEKLNFEISSLLTYPENSTERYIFGEELHCRFNGNTNIKSLTNIDIPELKGSIRSDRLDLIADLSIKDHFTQLSMLKPLNITLLPSPELINNAFAKKNALITYVPYIPMKIIVDAQPIMFNKNLFDDLVFTSTISLKQFDIVNKTWYREFSFDDTSVDIKGNSKKKKFQLAFKTHAQTKKTSAGILDCKLESNEFSSFDFYKKGLHGKIDFNDFSSALVDSMLGFKNELTDFFGNSFDLKIDYHKDNKETATKIDFDSSKLTADADVTFENDWIHSSSPIKLSWEISDNTLQSISSVFSQKKPSKEDSIKLTSPVILKGSISDLHWPIKAHEEGVFYDKNLDPILKKVLKNIQLSTFNVDFNLGSAEFKSLEDKRSTQLEDLQINLVKNSEDSPFIFNLKSEIEELGQHGKKSKGNISAAGTLNIPANGKEPVKTEINAHMHNFSTLILDSFVKTFGITYFMPSIFLGETVEASLNTKLGDLSGTFDFIVNSSDAKLNFNAFLNDGIVKLYKPIQGSLKITKNLADHLLKNMNISLVEADSPMELFISDKGFYLPLKPFRLENVQIRSGYLDLKRIRCSNTGSPGDINSIFKLNLSRNKDINLWFAPSEFSLSNGFLNIDRTEILYDNAYQIAVWGYINLVKQYVNMTLGLTEQSLREAFGLRGIPRSFVLQIPVTGPIGDIKINKELAATRIAFLIARTSGATQKGGMFGSIFDVLGDLANDQSSVPPPKRPFPWDNQLSDLLEQHRKEHSLHIMH